MPVSSYAPELLQVFQVAAKQSLEIPIADKRKATRLRARLNYLRAEMRKERHPLTNLANTVEFLLTSKGNLLCRPADASFLDAIKAAGVSIPLPSSPTSGPAVPGMSPATLAEEQIDPNELLQKLFNQSS